MKKLHYNTVSKTLTKCLKELMNEPLLKDFVLVGGTSLSLQLGHRVSIDIDLFTDSPYGSGLIMNQILSALEISSGIL